MTPCSTLPDIFSDPESCWPQWLDACRVDDAASAAAYEAAPPAQRAALKTGLALMANGVEAEKVWMSFERKMSCAVGKCGHCRIDEVYVCLDGPVFPYTVARDLVD